MPVMPVNAPAALIPQSLLLKAKVPAEEILCPPERLMPPLSLMVKVPLWMVSPPVVTSIPPEVTVRALAKVKEPSVPKSVPELPILIIGRLLIFKPVELKLATVVLFGAMTILPVVDPPKVRVCMLVVCIEAAALSVRLPEIEAVP